MFNSIKRLYEKMKNKNIVVNAVIKGWLTTQEYEEITGEDYTFEKSI